MTTDQLRSHVSSEVPVIDLAAHLGGSAAGHAAVVARLRNACSQVGFFVITGHGVDPALIAEMRGVSAAFFDLPGDEKRRYLSEPGRTLGYVPMGRENLAATIDATRPADFKEVFDICRPDVPDDSYYASPKGRRFFRPYTWPEQPPEFRETWTAYYRALEGLAAHIMGLFAEALNLPSGYFADKTDRSVDYLRVINYPAQDVPPVPGQLRAGEHTDYGTLTLVATDDAPGGLQVRARDGGWVDVPYVEGGFVVNIGDMMAQWTNDVWVSTLHRVANPDVGNASSRRQSIVFFQNPNYDTVIEPLSPCVTRDRPAAYAPTTAGEWLEHKVTKQRAQAPDDQE